MSLDQNATATATPVHGTERPGEHADPNTEIVRAHAEAKAAATRHGQLRLAAATRAVHAVLPQAASLVLDLRGWYDHVEGVQLRELHDAAGDPIPFGAHPEVSSALDQAAVQLTSTLEFATPELLDWEPDDPEHDEYPDQDRFRLVLPTTRTPADQPASPSHSHGDVVRFGELVALSPYVEHERYLVVFAATYDHTTPDVNVGDHLDAAAATLDLLQHSATEDGKGVWMVLDRHTGEVHYLEVRDFDRIELTAPGYEA